MSSADDSSVSPPPERGRSAREASRVGVRSKFNSTSFKTAFARKLRANSTNVEMRLWQKLRNRQLGVDFRRQHPAGKYVLDFYCPALRLAIELDGGQHSDGDQVRRDQARNLWLEGHDVTTLRFWNSDVATNLNGVLDRIAAEIESLRVRKLTPTRRWRADLPLSGGG
jgi:very-short-patch-repair endonuclease